MAETRSPLPAQVRPRTIAASVEDDVRLKYFEARRDEQSHDAIRAARIVAEAVCDGLIMDIPEEKRSNYGKGLNSQIEVLEQLSSRGEVIPRAVVAGLRALQAFGNYAAHYNKGDGKHPPAPATRSTMASLALVVQWFLGRSDEERPALALRQPPPAVPGIAERWRIHRRIKLTTPEFKVEGDVSSEAVLGALYTYYAQSVSICERISREIITRETMLDGAACTADQLPLLLEQVAEARPSRVPRSIAADVGELWRRRGVVLRAMREREEDTEHLLVEVKLRNLAKEVRAWFDGEYLTRSKVERFWPQYVVAIGVSLFVIKECRSDWKNEGREDLRVGLMQRFCSHEAAPANPVCTELARLAPAKK